MLITRTVEAPLIAGALVAPPSDRSFGSPPAARVTRLAAVVLLATAVSAVLAWFVLLSPFSLRRWDLYDPSQTITVKEPTTFVVYEEYAGAENNSTPPAVFVSIRSIGGRKIAVTNRGDENAPALTSYHTPWHEGRATAWFTIDKPGNYTVLAFPTGQGRPGTPGGAVDPGPVNRASGVDVSRLPHVALGSEGTPSSVGTLGGLAMLGGLPTVFGLGLLLVARRRWPPVELETAPLEDALVPV